MTVQRVMHWRAQWRRKLVAAIFTPEITPNLPVGKETMRILPNGAPAPERETGEAGPNAAA